MNENEQQQIEVYRLYPVLHRCYKYVEETRRTGYYPNNKYYAPKNDLVYVGKYIGYKRAECGWCTYLFEDEYENITRVHYYCEGMTCFIKVPSFLSQRSKWKSIVVQKLGEIKHKRNTGITLNRCNLLEEKVIGNRDICSHILTFLKS